MWWQGFCSVSSKCKLCLLCTPSVPLNFEEYAVQMCSIKIWRIGIQYALRVFIVQRPNSTPMQSRHCAKCSNLFFSSFPTPILWSFTNRVILLVLWCCYGQIWLLDVRILCTEPQFCHWGPSAPKKIDKPGYARYNTFFHAPKNNEGDSNLTLITWFPHRRPLHRWMRLIKIFFLITGLVILKLTQPLIPVKYPNSSKFNGTEGVCS
jgi:hypothetical protein